MFVLIQRLFSLAIRILGQPGRVSGVEGLEHLNPVIAVVLQRPRELLPAVFVEQSWVVNDRPSGLSVRRRFGFGPGRVIQFPNHAHEIPLAWQDRDVWIEELRERREDRAQLGFGHGAVDALVQEFGERMVGERERVILVRHPRERGDPRGRCRFVREIAYRTGIEHNDALIVRDEFSGRTGYGRLLKSSVSGGQASGWQPVGQPTQRHYGEPQ